jgi:hypothetical protein
MRRLCRLDFINTMSARFLWSALLRRDAICHAWHFGDADPVFREIAAKNRARPTPGLVRRSQWAEQQPLRGLIASVDYAIHFYL